MSRGGTQAVKNALVPVVVNPGAVKELAQFQVDLAGGEPWRKQYTVGDKRGDSWKTTFGLLPCRQ